MGILSIIEAILFIILSIKKQSIVNNFLINVCVMKLCSFGQLFTILSIMNTICIYTKYKTLRDVKLSQSLYTVIFYFLSIVLIISML